MSNVSNILIFHKGLSHKVHLDNGERKKTRSLHRTKLDVSRRRWANSANLMYFQCYAEHAIAKLQECSALQLIAACNLHFRTEGGHKGYRNSQIIHKCR